LSKLPIGPPFAFRAALHAAEPVSLPCDPQAAVRLIGLVVAPWAAAGGAGANASATQALTRVAAARALVRVTAGMTWGTHAAAQTFTGEGVFAGKARAL
jgi:hypothetical protein